MNFFLQFPVVEQRPAPLSSTPTVTLLCHGVPGTDEFDSVYYVFSLLDLHSTGEASRCPPFHF